jgi:DNA-binding LytR/AlgR family response regulator
MMPTFEINGNYLSKSGNNKYREETILKSEDSGISLFNNKIANKQPGNFFKIEERKRTRLVVKRGLTNIVLRLTDIAAIYTTNKLVYVIDHDSKKYSIDQTISALEEKLDSTIFFRANRQYLINMIFIRSFKAFQKVKLQVDLDISELEEPVIISQQTSPAFKKWMNYA